MDAPSPHVLLLLLMPVSTRTGVQVYMGVAYPGGGCDLGGATGGGRLQGNLVLLPLDLLQLHGHLLDGRYPLSPVGGAGGGAYT